MSHLLLAVIWTLTGTVTLVTACISEKRVLLVSALVSYFVAVLQFLAAAA